MLKITFAILTRNEEKNIERCLKSIKPLADEILVLDENSADKTREIARSFGAKIIQNNNSADFAAARNLGMEKAEKEWIFFIDADEKVIGEIREIGEIGKIGGFKIRRKDFMWGCEIRHGENGAWNEIRLVKKGSGQWEGKVHERFVLNDGDAAPAPHCMALRHYPHQTMREFLAEINDYSEMRAHELHEQGKKSSVWQIMAYPVGKFIWDYFFLLGILDGTPGFVIAVMMSLYSFLTRAKLYLLK